MGTSKIPRLSVGFPTIFALSTWLLGLSSGLSQEVSILFRAVHLQWRATIRLRGWRPLRTWWC